VGKVACIQSTRSHFGSPEVLDALYSLLERGMVSKDSEQIQSALHVVCQLADCETNKVKMRDTGYTEVVFHVEAAAAASDKVVRRLCSRFLMLLAESSECRVQVRGSTTGDDLFPQSLSSKPFTLIPSPIYQTPYT